MCTLTKKQIRILKIIRKYKNLNKILEVSKIDNYIALQYAFGAEQDYFYFTNMQGQYLTSINTEVFLTNKSISILESNKMEMFKFYLPLSISLISIVIALVALFFD